MIGLVPRSAHAVDLPRVGGSPVKLDITETAIAAQRFNAREGELEADQGYFVFLNRLNTTLGWRKLTLGVRLDSSFYALRPEDRDYTLPNGQPDIQLKRNAIVDGATRYRDRYVYIGKLWLTYKTEGLEATAGDSYVQFGRGLVLSLRKVDELGIDTTLLGGKVTFQKDPFSLTLIAGVTNPTRIDEPTGRALFLSKPVAAQRAGANNAASQAIDPAPVFGSDRIVGAQLQAGRGLPITSSTQAVRVTKCAPYRYETFQRVLENGQRVPDFRVIDDPLDAPFGTCDDQSNRIWFDTLPRGDINPTLRAREVWNASQSLEVPSLWGHGNLYVEAAVQKRQGERPIDGDNTGNAVYGSLVSSGGPITNTLEVKSYRNFQSLASSVNISRASAFANVTYSAPPTAEPIISDVMFGFFNTCVTGGRDRLDYRLTPTLLLYGAFGYSVTRSEVPGGRCDRLGRSTADDPANTTNYVSDGQAGLEWRFDDDKSILFANVVGRHDIKENGTPFYREVAGQYSLTKYIAGPYSFELAGRHRYRVQERENVRDVIAGFEGEPWWQGEHQNALKIAPKWVISQGFEYTTFIGLPTYYVNGGILYRFTTESNIRIYAGQNRGGLRCVSGICRVFPAFSGARVELTLRF